MLIALLLAQAAGPSLREALDDAVGACRARGGEIVVCRRPPAHRIPAVDTHAVAGGDAVDARDRAIAQPDAAVGSCSAIGANGATGCALRAYGAWGEGDRVARRAARAR